MAKHRKPVDRVLTVLARKMFPPEVGDSKTVEELRRLAAGDKPQGGGK